MKKSAKIISLGLSCALALSLAACGGDDGKNPSGNTGPDPDTVKTEQVTEAQWAAAFDLSDVTNVSVKYSQHFEVKELKQKDGEYDLYKFDGNKVELEEMRHAPQNPDQMTAPPKYVTSKTYFSKDGTDEYEYNYDESTKKWEKTAAQFPIRDPKNVGFSYNVLGVFDGKYSDFAYNSSLNAYVAENYKVPDTDYGSTYTRVSVKITNGKISVVQLCVEDEEGPYTVTQMQTLQWYDYGTTTVTLPSIGGENSDSGSGDRPGQTVTPGEGSNATVTKEDWELALSAEAFYNVTVTQTMRVDDRVMTYVNKYDHANKSVQMDGDGAVRLVTYVDGGYHVFYDFGQGWSYGGSRPSGFEGEIEDITDILGVFKYSAFTYKDGVYTAKNYTAEGMHGEVADVSLRFDHSSIVECEISMVQDGVKRVITMEFSDYGTTRIAVPDDLPEIESDSDNDDPNNGSGEEIKPSEWASILAEENFYNCTMSTEATTSDGKITSILKTDKTSGRVYVYNDKADMDMVAVRESETVWHVYVRNSENVWSSETVEQDFWAASCESTIATIVSFADRVDKFRYDKSTGEYVANNISIPQLSITADEVRLSFKDGKLLTVTIIAENLEMVLTVTDYGTTVIDIPEIDNTEPSV